MSATLRSMLTAVLLLWACVGACAEPSSAGGATGTGLTTLVYHNVVARGAALDAADTVTVDALARQIDWLQRNDYRFVSAEQVLNHYAGLGPLPDRAVLLTFDDGYRSFYTQVYPLLQTLNIPAVLAVVGAWIPENETDTVLVDDVPTPGTRFITRGQMQELHASGLVEIASHSFGEHRSIAANALGGRIPGVIARAYDAKTRRTETPAEYEQRLTQDLLRNAKFIRGITGQAPRLMVWPYGRYNGTALRVAGKTGHLMTLTLDDTSGGTGRRGESIARKYIQGDQNLDSFAAYVQRKAVDNRSLRHLSLNLDSLVRAEDSPLPVDKLIEKRLSSMLDTLVRSTVTTVLLNPFGGDCRAFFADQQRSVHQDLLSRVVWQLRTRARVQVLLDLDVAGCLRVEQAHSELLAVLNTASFDGLVMRTDGASAQLTEELAEVFTQEEPNKLLGGTTAFKGRGLALQVFSDCRLPSDENLLRVAAQNLWVSVELDGCDTSQAVARLRGAGVRHWGLEVPRRLQSVFAVPAQLMPSP